MEGLKENLRKEDIRFQYEHCKMKKTLPSRSCLSMMVRSSWFPESKWLNRNTAYFLQREEDHPKDMFNFISVFHVEEKSVNNISKDQYSVPRVCSKSTGGVLIKGHSLGDTKERWFAWSMMTNFLWEHLSDVVRPSENKWNPASGHLTTVLLTKDN